MYLVLTEDQTVFQTKTLSEKWINAVHEGVARLFAFEDGQFIEFSLDHTWDVVLGEEDLHTDDNPHAQITTPATRQGRERKIMEGTPFKELRLNDKPLDQCELVHECNMGNYRLYVDKDLPRETFYALAIEFVSAESESIWSCPELTVEPLFNVIAYFDGVRHLEFNREAGDMAGYIYYPSLPGLIEMLQKVHEIELEVCRSRAREEEAKS